MSDHATLPVAKLSEAPALDEIHLWSLAYRREQHREPLLRVLARYLGGEPSAVALVEGAYGRPELAHGHPEALHFNWSHSGERALVAVARSVQPGIDLELTGRRPQRAVEAIARRFFAAEESAWLEQLPPADRGRAFLQLWTAKEALLKAHGQGLSFGLHRVRVTFDQGAPLLHAFDEEHVDAWQLRSLPIGPGYVAALAWRGGPMHLRWMTPSR